MRRSRFSPARSRSIVTLLAASLALAACGGSDEAATDETSTTVQVTTALAETTTTSEEGADETTTTASTTTTTESTTTAPPAEEDDEDDTDESGDDAAELCDAYLGLVSTGDTGALAAAIGEPAPPGVLDALAVLDSGDAEIDLIFEASDNLRAYVEPVCRDRWDADLEPAASNDAAAETFFAALVDGDRGAAADVAPDDVLAQFGDFEPLTPDADVGSPALFAEPGVDNFTMLLAPTVTVFCTLDQGVVIFCGFGE